MESEEEDTLVLGGQGFTPEELAHAEHNFTKLFVSHPIAALCVRVFKRQRDSLQWSSACSALSDSTRVLCCSSMCSSGAVSSCTEGH